MYSHVLIITLILSAPRGAHDALLYDQIADIPSLHFPAPSLVRKLFLFYAALKAVNISVCNMDLSYSITATSLWNTLTYPHLLKSPSLNISVTLKSSPPTCIAEL